MILSARSSLTRSDSLCVLPGECMMRRVHLGFPRLHRSIKRTANISSLIRQMWPFWVCASPRWKPVLDRKAFQPRLMLPLQSDLGSPRDRRRCCDTLDVFLGQILGDFLRVLLQFCGSDHLTKQTCSDPILFGSLGDGSFSTSASARTGDASRLCCGIGPCVAGNTLTSRPL